MLDTMRSLILPVVLLALCPLDAGAQPRDSRRPADRLARVDENGVIRWRDDGTEVALFGVNYYPPFSIDWKVIHDRGLDHKAVIRQDVAHFAQMGLTAIRLHCWDRELSDRKGNLLQNEHLDLLDYLIAQCKSRGIYSVMTPMAWWPTPNPCDGFSNEYTMHQMTTDAEARRAQMRYLKQFAEHRNSYTGLTYEDDPAVVAFELINEPIFPAGTSDEDVTKYINDLAGAIKGTGCEKPIFFNGWGGRLDAVGKSVIEGCSFGWYPTGLVAGRALRRNYLARVQDYPSMRDPALAHKAKIVYEFDAADVPYPYMYPAMARAFRSGGAQIATQFQYEPMAIAATNENWQTHFLDLCYTPKKAVSFMIAAQAFYRLPRLKTYGSTPGSDRFDVFRVSYDERLSEMVTDELFMYANDTATKPPDPRKLRRVVGCGSSPVVRYGGAGAYFLDRLGEGVWRLTVYPDAVWVRDPYSGGRAEKVRILWREWPMQIRLPDLGDDFAVTRVAPQGQERARANDATIAVEPGIYICVARGKSAPPVNAGNFVAPPPSSAPAAVFHEPVTEWLAGRPWTAKATIAAAEDPSAVTLYFRPPGEAEPTTILMKQRRAYEWAAEVPARLLEPGEARYGISLETGGETVMYPGGRELRGKPLAPVQTKPAVLFSVKADDEAPKLEFGLSDGHTCSTKIVQGSADGRFAVRMAATGFGKPPSCVALRWPATVPPENRDRYNVLAVRARGDEGTFSAEVSLVEEGGAGYGYNVPLGPAWRTARVRLDKLRPLWSTKGNAVDLSRVTEVRVIFGSWLYGESGRGPHALEVESIALEEEEAAWRLPVVAPTAPVVLFSGDRRAPRMYGGETPHTTARVAGMTPDSTALRVAVPGFGKPPSSLSFRASVDEGLEGRRSAFRRLRALHVRARAGEPATTGVEVVLIERDGAPWGTVVPLTDKWQDIAVPFDELTYFKHWNSGPADRGGPGDTFHPERVDAVNVCFGAWLYPDHEGERHAIEIDSITLETE